MTERVRATVVDDQDPMRKERILVRPDGNDDAIWAEPCLLYNPCGQGSYSAPPPGSQVWIEFEQGDPERPVWLGLCLA